MDSHSVSAYNIGIVSFIREKRSKKLLNGSLRPREQKQHLLWRTRFSVFIHPQAVCLIQPGDIVPANNAGIVAADGLLIFLSLVGHLPEVFASLQRPASLFDPPPAALEGRLRRGLDVHATETNTADCAVAIESHGGEREISVLNWH